MKLLHEKSVCCGTKIIRFGGKRRQCVACKKTWRVHPAKKGRKRARKQFNYLKKVFEHSFSVVQLAWHSSLAVDAIYKRFAKNLEVVVSQKRTIRIRGQQLILIIDAEWQYFNDSLWTLYFFAVKPINTETVIVFDPILKPGKENITTWKEVINQLPRSLRKRVIALVSDGVRGIEAIAKDNGWILQRCHFHLISLLQKMRGKRATTSGRLIRERIFLLVKSALKERSARKVNILCQHLILISRKEGCPKRMRMPVNEFLRRISDFRSYLDYPEFKLPTTTNVMESINSFVRQKTRTLNTPISWHKWAIACVRFKSIFTCK